VTLQRDWALYRAGTRSDIYLLSPISDCCRVKSRGGERLEIRHRPPDPGAGILHCWTVARPSGFQLDAADFLYLAVALGLSEIPDGRAALSPAHLA